MIYPVAPGEVVGDAPRSANLFAVELIKSVKVPGLSFKEVFRRVPDSGRAGDAGSADPSESSPSPDDLVISSTRKPAATPAPPVRAADPVELGFWDTIKGSDNPADFKAYLDSYPDGPFAVVARARLEQIEAKAVTRPAVPARRRLPRLQPTRCAPATCRVSACRVPGCSVSSRHPRLSVMSRIGLDTSGVFEMGSTEMFDFEGAGSPGVDPKPFYIGRREVTFEEWDACIAEAAASKGQDDRGLGRAPAPGD